MFTSQREIAKNIIKTYILHCPLYKSLLVYYVCVSVCVCVCVFVCVCARVSLGRYGPTWGGHP